LSLTAITLSPLSKTTFEFHRTSSVVRFLPVEQA